MNECAEECRRSLRKRAAQGKSSTPRPGIWTCCEVNMEARLSNFDSSPVRGCSLRGLLNSFARRCQPQSLRLYCCLTSVARIFPVQDCDQRSHSLEQRIVVEVQAQGQVEGRRPVEGAFLVRALAALFPAIAKM